MQNQQLGLKAFVFLLKLKNNKNNSFQKHQKHQNDINYCFEILMDSIFMWDCACLNVLSFHTFQTIQFFYKMHLISTINLTKYVKLERGGWWPMAPVRRTLSPCVFIQDFWGPLNLIGISISQSDREFKQAGFEGVEQLPTLY